MELGDYQSHTSHTVLRRGPAGGVTRCCAAAACTTSTHTAVSPRCGYAWAWSLARSLVLRAHSEHFSLSNNLRACPFSAPVRFRLRLPSEPAFVSRALNTVLFRPMRRVTHHKGVIRAV